MHKLGEETHVDTNEARGGETPHIVRYILIISLVLAIGALSAIWMFGAARSEQPDRVGDISGQATPH